MKKQKEQRAKPIANRRKDYIEEPVGETEGQWADRIFGLEEE